MVRINKSMDLPRFIFGEDSSGERQFIIHTQEPRFVGEIFDNDAGGSDITEIQFIDVPEPDAKALAKLMREAGDALCEYDENLGLY